MHTFFKGKNFPLQLHNPCEHFRQPNYIM